MQAIKMAAIQETLTAQSQGSEATHLNTYSAITSYKVLLACAAVMLWKRESSPCSSSRQTEVLGDQGGQRKAPYNEKPSREKTFTKVFFLEIQRRHGVGVQVCTCMNCLLFDYTRTCICAVALTTSLIQPQIIQYGHTELSMIQPIRIEL